MHPMECMLLWKKNGVSTRCAPRRGEPGRFCSPRRIVARGMGKDEPEVSSEF